MVYMKGCEPSLTLIMRHKATQKWPIASLTPKGINIQEKSLLSFYKILKNKWYHAKVLNVHNTGFR